MRAGVRAIAPQSDCSDDGVCPAPVSGQLGPVYSIRPSVSGLLQG